MHSPWFLMTAIFLTLYFPIITPVILKNVPKLTNKEVCFNPLNLTVFKSTNCSISHGIPIKYYKRITIHISNGYCKVVKATTRHDLPPICPIINGGLATSRSPYDITLKCEITVNNKTRQTTFHIISCSPYERSIRISNKIIEVLETNIGNYTNIETNTSNKHRYCIQILVKAYDPMTNSIKTYPTPCDVPKYAIPIKQYTMINIKSAICRLINMDIFNIKHKIKEYFITPYNHYYTAFFRAEMNCILIFQNKTKINSNMFVYGLVNNNNIGIIASNEFYVNNTSIMKIVTKNKKYVFLFNIWKIPKKYFIKLYLTKINKTYIALNLIYLYNNTTETLKIIPINKKSKSIIDILNRINTSNKTKVYLFYTIPIIGAVPKYSVKTIYI